ncbi:MAG TPA: NlpC/P60 family protein [Nakamurella sp.]
MAIGRAVRALGGRRVPWWVWLLSAKAVIVGILVVVCGLAIVGAVGSSGAQQPGSACGTAGGPAVTGRPVAVAGNAPGLTAEQLHNAQAIAGVALGLGLGQQGVLIGIVTAITESTLVNINFGDFNSNGTMTTSRGPFQQIDAWGPLADRLDPVKAATMFYTGGQAGQRGLMQVPGWQQMTVAAASQAVQGSQFASGSNYQTNLTWAQSITTSLMAGQPTASASLVSGPTTAVIAPLPAAALRAGCGATPAAGAPAGAVPVSLNGPVVTVPNDPNVAAALRGYQLATGSTGIAKGLAAGFAVLGMPYVWSGGGDGAGPNNGCARGGGQLNSCGSTIGFDCSGLTAYVIVQGGFPSPGGNSGAQAQPAHAPAWAQGVQGGFPSPGGNSGAQAQPAHAVPWAQGAPGDLIVFPGHVAVFLGVIAGTPYILEASDVGIPIHVVPLTRTDHGSSMYRYWS